jgi:MFS family permease
MSALSFLDRERTVAGAGYSRWLVPPAALAIHLAIGQVYALSVFNLPMTRLLGITKSAPEDWAISTVVVTFSIALGVLGGSAALFGAWLERVGPRRAMFTSALCFGGGFLVGGLGILMHSIALVYLGYGAIGGVGLGLGYISPVSTLIKWFPDRPGMATGMAIMGFGGGAMIGSPLATNLMDHFKTPTSTGVAETFFTMGVIYLVYMMFGVFTVRVPAADWKPEGYVQKAPSGAATAPGNASVSADEALKTPQFWLLWGVLFLNVTAGLGVLSQASPMIQEMFAGKYGPAAAAGFVGLLSLFNLLGRFLWSSFSDVIGRKPTYMVYFVLGAVLYALVPSTGKAGSVAAFLGCSVVILSMYGGGFATVPAYLRDMFGVYQVGAIHGRLLTAWSAAALVGPTIITNIRDYQLAHGVAKTDVYTTTMYIMAGLLVIGFFCNLAVRPVDPKHYVQEKSPKAA